MDMLRAHEFSTPTRLQLLESAVWQPAGIRVFMKREDARDAVLGGNKWCKLAGHLEAAAAAGQRRLVSVGGLWSNHLHALAHAGQRFGFATVGIVRGEAVAMTDMLREAQAAGMALEFVSRSEFRERHDTEWQQTLEQRFGPCRFIPEGGAGEASLPGLKQLADELAQQIDGPVLLALPVGSGTTLAGLRRFLPSRFTLWGFQSFADKTLAHRIGHALADDEFGAWHLQDTDAMRSHRELPVALQDFCRDFERAENIALDPVYTLRMMARLQALLSEGRVPAGTTVVALHTGGLQGRRGHGLALAA
jgi:1-aminocyclopropane-1-carboxylate deaminase